MNWYVESVKSLKNTNPILFQSNSLFNFAAFEEAEKGVCNRKMLNAVEYSKTIVWKVYSSCQSVADMYTDHDIGLWHFLVFFGAGSYRNAREAASLLWQTRSSSPYCSAGYCRASKNFFHGILYQQSQWFEIQRWIRCYLENIIFIVQITRPTSLGNFHKR